VDASPWPSRRWARAACGSSCPKRLAPTTCVVDDVIDERLSHPSPRRPASASSPTEEQAGELGSGVCRLQLRPFGVLGRIAPRRRVGFWDLVDARDAPEEDGELRAHHRGVRLILRNLQRLKFAGSQIESPEVHRGSRGAPGKRLGLVARRRRRASARSDRSTWTSSAIGSQRDGRPFAIQVPKEVVWQARDACRLSSTRRTMTICAFRRRSTGASSASPRRWKPNAEGAAKGPRRGIGTVGRFRPRRSSRCPALGVGSFAGARADWGLYS